MLKILAVFGTRPEAIKMAPVIRTLDDNFDVKICVTAQHRQMLDQVLELFEITPDYDLDIMQPEQDLFDVTSNVLSGIKKVLQIEKPDIDDLRESPALSIMRKISLMGFSEVLLAEPNIFTLPKEFKNKEQLVSLVLADEAIRAADIVVLLVDHTPFKSIDLGLLSGKQIVDTRGIWS